MESLDSSGSHATSSCISVCSNAANLTMANATSPAGSSSADSHSAMTLSALALNLLRWLPAFLYWVVTFATITLPTWLFTLFSMSLTFTMNFTTLCVLQAGIHP